MKKPLAVNILAVLLPLLFLVAGGSAQTVDRAGGQPPVPVKPEIIYVADFALDSGNMAGF